MLIKLKDVALRLLVVIIICPTLLLRKVPGLNLSDMEVTGTGRKSGDE